MSLKRLRLQRWRLRLAVEELEPRLVPDGSSYTIPLDPDFDQFGDQIATIQAYEDFGRLAIGIFDSGASAVTFSALEQAFFATPIPVKVPGGAIAEGIGGTIVGDVSQPGTILADGLHAMSLVFDEFGYPFFDISIGPSTAMTPGIQAFIGTDDGSPLLPTITGTPLLSPSANNPNGLAALIDMQGISLDFSDLIEGLVLTMPDIHFVAPGVTPTVTAGATTEPFYVSLDSFGSNNYANPGDFITDTPSPLQSHVQLVLGGISLSDQHFLLDTGAQLTVISTSEALQLGLDLDLPETTITVTGVAGEKTVPGFTLSELNLPTTDGGILQFTNVPVYVLDIAPGVDGLLGMNLFNTTASMTFDPYTSRDPNNPMAGSLGLTFYTDPNRGLPDIDLATADLLRSLGLSFIGTVSGHGLPGFGRANQTITFGPLADQTYGAAPFQVSASASSGLPVSFQVVSGPATISGDTVTITGTGTVVVEASQAGNGNYNAAPTVHQSFMVAPASPTVAANANGGTFNGQAFPATATVTGVVAGVDNSPSTSLEGVSPTLSYYADPSTSGTPLADAPVGAGTYTAAASFAGSANYSSASASATFTITQATPTVAVSDSGGVYNGQAFPATATVAGVVPGVDDSPSPSLEGVSPTLSYYAGTSASGTPLAGAPVAAGTYTVAASFAGSANYSSANASTTFIISGPSKLAFSPIPTPVHPGSPLPSFQVDVLDPDGNLVSGDSSEVTVTATGPGSFSAGQATVAAVQGVATFSDLVLMQLGTYTLTATAGGLTPAVSNSFTVTFSDDFNQPNGTPLGPIWTVWSGSFRVQVLTGGGAVAVGTGKVNVATANTILPQANVAVKATVKVAAGSALALVARASESAAGNMYFGEVRNNAIGSYLASIWRKRNGITTRLTAYVNIGKIGRGTLLFKVVGSTLRLYWKAKGQHSFHLVRAVQDKTLTSGSVGLRVSKGSSLTDFTADAVPASSAPVSSAPVQVSANFAHVGMMLANPRNGTRVQSRGKAQHQESEATPVNGVAFAPGPTKLSTMLAYLKRRFFWGD